MNSPTFVRRAHLPRLPAEYYRGRAFVHWTMTVDHRETGWLTPGLFGAFRLTLLHVLARHGLACPAYCLMPDHLQLVGAGLHDASDQRLACAFFRRHFSRLLSPRRLQWQPYDHVLRAQERTAEALTAVTRYILENPVRAGLCEDWREYPFSGALIAGFPDLDLRRENFWRIFRQAYGNGAPIG